MIFRIPILLSLAFLMSSIIHAQHKVEFKGEASVYGSYSPNNELDLFVGARYVPELSYGYTFDNKSLLDVELSANINGSLLFHPFDCF